MTLICPRFMASVFLPSAVRAVLVVALVASAGCEPATESLKPEDLKTDALFPEPAADNVTPSSPNAQEPAVPPATGDVVRTDAAEYVFVKPPLTDEELRAGWISVFDGVTLFGWEVPKESNWHVEDACIVADSGDKSLLMTPFRFADFEMRCDFHLAEGGNSGVFLRCDQKVANAGKDTYELNICDSHPTHGTASFVNRFAAENVPKVEGSWHTFRILCEGPRLQVWLDEAPVTDFTDTSDAIRLDGTIGLQFNAGRIAFRHVVIRPLNGRELLNSDHTDSWRVVPGSKSSFAMADGVLHVTNGPGFLETNETFGDFILHVEAKTNGTALNSGVFFRAMPGTEKAPSNGYEMQIQNGTKDGDRTQPADAGTGAIFRRVPARYVVSNDHEWFTETLIAQGDHFGTWVNGYQVVNWQDTREANENPRQGRRLDAGHISLQGHDPTTDLEFRSIRIH